MLNGTTVHVFLLCSVGKHLQMNMFHRERASVPVFCSNVTSQRVEGGGDRERGPGAARHISVCLSLWRSRAVCGAHPLVSAHAVVVVVIVHPRVCVSEWRGGIHWWKSWRDEPPPLNAPSLGTTRGAPVALGMGPRTGLWWQGLLYWPQHEENNLDRPERQVAEWERKEKISTLSCCRFVCLSLCECVRQIRPPLPPPLSPHHYREGGLVKECEEPVFWTEKRGSEGER